MASIVHACRADYVTYCNARNAYKQKRRPPPRAAGFRPREMQRFRGSASPEVSKKVAAFKREKEEVGGTEIRTKGIEIVTREKNNARPFITRLAFSAIIDYPGLRNKNTR